MCNQAFLVQNRCGWPNACVAMKLSLMLQACLRDSAREAVRDGVQKFGIFEQVTPEYVDAIHASGFRDFLLKPELLRGIVDRGFEHPSEVQHECIPQAVLGAVVLRRQSLARL